jgi:hypothetical protein
MSDLQTTDWAIIEAQLPPDWQKLAYEHGAMALNSQPHLGGKISGPGDLLRLILFHVAGGASLRTATALAAASGLPDISPVALHKRMRRAGEWLGALCSRMTEANMRFHPERWGGFEVIAADATVVCRPGAKGTTVRVHLAFRLADLCPRACFVTDEHGGETFTRFSPRRGELWLGDRGYSNPPGIAHVVAAGADVLVRCNRGTLPLHDRAGRPIAVLERLRRLRRGGQCGEWQAFVHPGEGRRIEGRLCAVRLPAAEAEAARDRTRREQGPSVSAEALEASEYVAVFTTVPRERLCLHLVLELYRLRWQIELEFKRSKSISGLDELPCFREDTILSWILAKLLARSLAARLATPRVAFPPSAGRRR